MTTQDPFSILEYPLQTEKAVKQMEMENCLIFIVRKSANKKQVRWACEKAFNVKVADVRTMIQHDGKKKAYIKLKPETPASEVTTKLGLV